MFTFLTKVFEIAEPKYLGEHRELLPEQMHGFTLVPRNVDTSWTAKKLRLVRRNDANIILMEPGVWLKWFTHDNNGVGLRPEATLLC